MNNYYQYGNPNVVPMVPQKPAANANNANNAYNPYAQNQQQGYPNQQYNYQQQQANQYQQPGYAQSNPYQPQQQQQQQYQNQQQYANQQQQNKPATQQQPQQQQQYNQQYNQYQQQQQPNMGQQNVNKPVEGFSQFPEHQRQIEQLKQRYPYQIVSPQFPSEVGKKTVVNIELDIPNFKIPIKIELDFDFPQSKPSVFLRKRFNQMSVNQSTLRFMYESNFRWEPTSTLLSLVTAIHQALQQSPPQADVKLERIKEMKELINEGRDRQQFTNVDVQKVFPQYSQQQLSEVLKKPSFAEYILPLKEMEDLKGKLAEFANSNVALSSELIDQQANLEVKKMELSELASQYQKLNQDLQQMTSITNNIKERFGDMSIIQALGQKIYEVEEQGQNLQCNSIEEEIRQYKQNRQLYHTLNMKREKLTNSN